MHSSTQRENSRERFSEHAAAYVTSTSHANANELDLLAELGVPQPDWLVLDVATGGGHTALRFAPLVRKVLATDITPAMLKAARGFISGQGASSVEYGFAAAEDLPFATGSFDLVTCRIAPHHFDDCARFVRESARVLRKGGLLLVQDHLLPNDPVAAQHMERFEQLRDPSHHRAFSANEWTDMFGEAGLGVERVEVVVKQHSLVYWATRQGCTEGVIRQLREMLSSSTGVAREWMAPHELDSDAATFSARHIVLSGRK